MKLLSNIFGGKQARVTYRYPIPEDLVDWGSRAVFEAMRDWANRLGNQKTVQNFARTASDESKSLWWQEQLFRAKEKIESDYAIWYIEGLLANKENDLVHAAGKVEGLRQQLAQMRENHKKHYDSE